MSSHPKFIPFKHGLIFITYFFVASLLLFGHQGGSDIAFMLLISLCFIVHFIVLIVEAITAYNSKDENSGKTLQDRVLSMFALMAAIVFFIMLSDKFLSFMWWLTNKLK